MDCLLEIAEQLEQKHFLYLPADKIKQIMGEILLHYPTKETVRTFIQSWEGLGEDTFMADGGKYRQRAHAVFETVSSEQSIQLLPYQPHYQTKDYNTLNGGVARYFQEISGDFLQNEVFEALIKLAYSVFSKCKPKNYFIGVHQFRITAKEKNIGLPTPEGVHRDGVSFVFMVMASRCNVEGGETAIYDLERNKLSAFTLSETFDAAIVDDTQVFHGVSPIFRKDENIEKAYRDVLVITFKEKAAV
ncbi:2OG-Fe dioxygenase family protein [Neisseria animalis]|uniref:2OG-Fe dioxygenase family protein n=1 Tax=Neisseria animalis TaxID=492 RepID=UPI0013BE9F43|nr:2OG-Fe dioxygenase family protein [Neisseria animalis]